MCSGITRGSVLNGAFYAQRFQKLIYLHLCIDSFMRISPQRSEQIHLCKCHWLIYNVTVCQVSWLSWGNELVELYSIVVI